MRSLIALLVTATVVFVYGRPPGAQGEMEIKEETPPSLNSKLSSSSVAGEMEINEETPPSSTSTLSSASVAGIMAPPSMKKCPIHRMKYSEKIRALIKTPAFPYFFENGDITEETSIIKTWLKKAASRMQDDENKGTIDNFQPDFVIESENSLEFAPDPNAPGLFYFNPAFEKHTDDGGEDGEKFKKSLAKSPFGFLYSDPKIEHPTTLMQEFEPPRPFRQNPNLSRTKSLVANELDQLRTGISHEVDTASRKPQVFTYNSGSSPGNSLYDVTLLAAICVGTAMALFGFIFGLYKITQKVSAAADVDYPAYGVTGPSIETSADRKLAQSAHMYHYQHQKQQIIAMEKTGMDTRNGSVSDPDSEEENEEGDYTVYECPGFATTGNMEVENPMFIEEPTLATPGKYEVVHPQPKV